MSSIPSPAALSPAIPFTSLIARSLAVLRLSAGLAMLGGALIFFLGTSWDIHWHTYVGRDRTLIPPHIMMLSGIALSGLAALGDIALESLGWRKSDARLQTQFVGLFRGGLGAYIAGFAALAAGLAFPLDSYWHALYGIDVSIWAPFHIMFIVGMAGAALGGIYLLAAAANLAGSGNLVTIARLGMMVGFAVVLSIFTFLLFNALKRSGNISAGIEISLFPLLALPLCIWVLLASVIAIPWRHAALSVTGIYLLLAVIVGIFVPPATSWLVTAENLLTRSHLPALAVVTLNWPISPLFAAIAIDRAWHLAQRSGWPEGRLRTSVVLTALVGGLPLLLLVPLYLIGWLVFLGLPGLVLSLGFGGLTGLIGYSFGRAMGALLRAQED